MKKPIVSVVVTTRNEEANIENCLRSITAQTYPSSQIEIIIVDNNSSDATKEIAKKHTKYVFNKGPERSAQRNYGSKVAHGTYYLYLDADMMLDKYVVSEAVQILEKHSEIVALYIPEVVTGESLFSKVRRFERSFYTGTIVDCVRFVRLEAVRKVGGFDETMSGPEDWDFDKKIREIGKISIIKHPIFHNETEISLYEYLTKKTYYAQSMKTYISKWGEDDPDIQKQLGIYYRYIGVFTEYGKWIRLLRHPMLTSLMLLLRLMVGIQYLRVKINSKL